MPKKKKTDIWRACLPLVAVLVYRGADGEDRAFMDLDSKCHYNAWDFRNNNKDYFSSHVYDS